MIIDTIIAKVEQNKGYYMVVFICLTCFRGEDGKHRNVFFGIVRGERPRDQDQCQIGRTWMVSTPLKKSQLG